MASGPTTSWQIDGETVETVADFIILGSKITADGDCSHEIKRHSLLGRKVMTNLDSILEKEMATHSSTLAWRIPWTEEPGWLQSTELERVGHDWATSLSLSLSVRQHIEKQRHYFANKGPSSQGYGFSSGHVWMWELDCEESWALKMMLLNCGVGEDSWESLGLQRDPTSQS